MTVFNTFCRRSAFLYLAHLPALMAATLPPTGNGQAVAAARSFALENVREHGERATVTVGPLGPDTRLAACERLDVFLPPNHRLWGKTSLGVKCVAPQGWTTYVPVHVKVSGHYLVSTRKINAGQVVTASDLGVVTGDLTTLPNSILSEPAQAIGHRLKSSLGAKQALQREDLVLPPVIKQGDKVKIRVRNDGFVAETEGIALNDAAEGATIKVRNLSGKTLSGRARGAGEVEISP